MKMQLTFDEKTFKPRILAIVGESGTGKTTIAEYIETKYSIPMIQSYTDRQPRYEGENGHKFVTQKEFDKFNLEDMIAFTKFGNNRYCCLHKDVKQYNTYVIDEKGLDFLMDAYSNRYDVISLRVKRNIELRKKSVDPERLLRDKGMFYHEDKFFDEIINNSFSMKDLKESIDSRVKKYFPESYKKDLLIFN